MFRIHDCEKEGKIFARIISDEIIMRSKVAIVSSVVVVRHDWKDLWQKHLIMGLWNEVGLLLTKDLVKNTNNFVTKR